MLSIGTTDRRGFVVSIEMVLGVVVAVIGLVVAATALRDSIVSDVAGSVDDVNQSFRVKGATSTDASVAGSGFTDRTDSEDAPDDASGVADNGILFGSDPLDEGEIIETTSTGDGGTTSAEGTFKFDPFTSGGPATGSIGDGTIDTNFTVTGSDTGIVLGTDRNEIVFSEQPGNVGSVTTSFVDPLTDVELFFSSVTNDGAPHLIENFSVTLSDGTTINNADFSVVPDAISPSINLGAFFTTTAKDFELLSQTTIGGTRFVTDGSNDGAGFGNRQAAGRIRFTDSTITNAPSGVGISSITFHRSGVEVGYTSRFSVSGRVNQ